MRKAQGPLQLKTPGEPDYILPPNKSCWIETGGLVAYIRHTDDQRLVIEVFRTGAEMGLPYQALDLDAT